MQSGIFQKFHISKLNVLIVFVLHVFSLKYKKNKQIYENDANLMHLPLQYHNGFISP